MFPEYGRGGEATNPLIIQFDIKTSEFKLGPSCKFHHPLNRLDPFVKLTLAGLPRREVDILMKQNAIIFPEVPSYCCYLAYPIILFHKVKLFSHSI